MLLIMFVGEVFLPGLTLFPGLPRLFAALGLCLLMAGIMLTGNWGFFNIIFAIVCIPLFADSSFAITNYTSFFDENIFVNVILVLHFIGGILYFPGTSYTVFAMPYLAYNDTWAYKKLRLDVILRFYRFIAPFRLIHSYGVFGPNVIPPIRTVLVIEGSIDGRNWESYKFRYLPNSEYDSPRFVAPHHPRLEHLLFYMGSGQTFSDFLSAPIWYIPYNMITGYSAYSWLDGLLQRLLEGSKITSTLFKSQPFDSRAPKFVRVVKYFYTPSSIKELRKTGRWWHKEFSGVIIQPRTSEPKKISLLVPPPVMLHPIQNYWKKKSPLLAAFDDKEISWSKLNAAVANYPGINPSLLNLFWHEYLPFLRSSNILDGKTFGGHVLSFNSRFSPEQRYKYDQILDLYAFAFSYKNAEQYIAIQIRNKKASYSSIQTGNKKASYSSIQTGNKKNVFYFYFFLTLKYLIVHGELEPRKIAYIDFIQIIKKANSVKLSNIFGLYMLTQVDQIDYLTRLNAFRLGCGISEDLDSIVNFLCKDIVFPTSQVFNDAYESIV